MEKYSIIFDLDGTIADTLELTFQGLNRVLTEYGRAPLIRQQFESLRAMTPRQIMKQFRISYFQLPIIIARMHAELRTGMKDVQPFAGMSALLLSLHEQGVALGLLTSNAQENVQDFLTRHQLTFFDFIHAGTDIFGKSRKLKKIIKEKRLLQGHIAYVGDEVRDITAARNARVTSIAVTWGFNTRSILEAQRPDYLAESPKVLEDIIGQIL
ncbi:MAG: HAD-IA family hydrolase [Patescibacteria group bacterium]